MSSSSSVSMSKSSPREASGASMPSNRLVEALIKDHYVGGDFVRRRRATGEISALTRRYLRCEDSEEWEEMRRSYLPIGEPRRRPPAAVGLGVVLCAAAVFAVQRSREPSSALIATKACEMLSKGQCQTVSECRGPRRRTALPRRSRRTMTPRARAVRARRARSWAPTAAVRPRAPRRERGREHR